MTKLTPGVEGKKVKGKLEGSVGEGVQKGKGLPDVGREEAEVESKCKCKSPS